MADAKKKGFEKFMSPKGVLIFPKLNAPDTKFKAEGEYATKLQPLNAAEGDAFIEQYEAAVAAHFEAVKADLEAKLAEAKTGAEKGKLKKEIAELKLGDKPYKPAFDDDGNETGEFIINFKLPAKVTFKSGPKAGKTQELRPDIFDAKGKLLKSPPQIWGGTVGYVAGEFRPYYTAKAGVGVSLRLLAVQVVELSSGGGDRSASGYGFGSEEGGYEAEDEPTMPDRSGAEDEGGAAGASDEDF